MTGVCAEPGHSEPLEKSKTNVRPWSPLRAASSSGSDGWATATEKTDASCTPAPGFCLLPPNGAGFVSQNGVVCAAVGAPGRRGERAGEGAGLLLCRHRASPKAGASPLLPSVAQLVPWVFLPGLPTGCLLSQARGHRTPCCVISSF